MLKKGKSMQWEELPVESEAYSILWHLGIPSQICLGCESCGPKKMRLKSLIVCGSSSCPVWLLIFCELLCWKIFGVWWFGLISDQAPTSRSDCAATFANFASWLKPRNLSLFLALSQAMTGSSQKRNICATLSPWSLKVGQFERRLLGLRVSRNPSS